MMASSCTNSAVPPTMAPISPALATRSAPHRSGWMRRVADVKIDDRGRERQRPADPAPDQLTIDDFERLQQYRVQRHDIQAGDREGEEAHRRLSPAREPLLPNGAGPEPDRGGNRDPQRGNTEDREDQREPRPAVADRDDRRHEPDDTGKRFLGASRSPVRLLPSAVLRRVRRFEVLLVFTADDGSTGVEPWKIRT